MLPRRQLASGHVPSPPTKRGMPPGGISGGDDVLCAGRGTGAVHEKSDSDRQVALVLGRLYAHAAVTNIAEYRVNAIMGQFALSGVPLGQRLHSRFAASLSSAASQAKFASTFYAFAFGTAPCACSPHQHGGLSSTG